jgi:VCBS repeat-containing protein
MRRNSHTGSRNSSSSNAARAAQNRIRAQRASHRIKQQALLCQARREKRIARWRRLFPSRFMPINLSGFRALWAVIAGLMGEVFGARKRSLSMAGRRFGHEPLEARQMLAADFMASAFTFGDVTNDQGTLGVLDAGDTVAFAHPSVGAPTSGVFGADAFLTIQEATDAASANGEIGDTVYVDSTAVGQSLTPGTDGTTYDFEAHVNEGGSVDLNLDVDGTGVDTVSVSSGSISLADSPNTHTYTTNPATEGPATATINFTTVGGLAGTVTVEIRAVNEAPSFTLDNTPVTVNEDAGATVVAAVLPPANVETNDPGQDYTITTSNDNNSLFAVQPTIDKTTGDLTFTPAPDAFGTATVTVTVQDDGGTANGGADSSSVTFTITVDGVNDAPVQVSSGPINVNEGSQIIIRGNYGSANSQRLVYTDLEDGPEDIVYTLDSIAPGAELWFSNTTKTGTNSRRIQVGETFTQAELNDNSSNVRIRYFHDGSEPAPAGFTYTVRDSDNAAVSGTYTVNVNQVNDAPVATDDAFGTDQDTTITAGNLIGNDTDAEGHALSIVEVNGNPVSVGTPIALSSGAILTINADNTFSYNPNGAFDNLATGATAPDSFTYRVTDGQVANNTSNVATVNITITGVNDAPVVTTNDGLTVVEGGASSLATLLVTSDIDDAAADITYTVTSLPTNGTLSLTTFTQAQLNSGAVTYTHNGGETTSDSFGFSVTDGESASLTGTFAIVVTPINDAPSVSAPTDLAATEETASSLVGAFVIADPDVPAQTLTVDLTVNSGVLNLSGTPSGVTVVSGAGTAALKLSGTAANLQAALNAGALQYTGNAGVFGDNADSLSISVNDGIATATTSSNIDVTGVNDAPTFTLDNVPVTVNEDNDQAGGVTIAAVLPPANVNTNDPGQDYSVSTLNNNNALFAVQPTIDKATGNLTFTLANHAFGTATVTVTVQDNGGTANGGIDTATDTFVITVNSVEDQPTVVVGPVTMGEGQLFVLTTSQISVTDPEQNPSQLTITATLPAGLGLEVNGVPATSFTYAQLQLGQVRLRDLDPAGVAGSTSVVLSISDGVSAAVPANLAVNVTPINDAPVLGVIGTGAGYTEGDPAVDVVDVVTITDSDPDGTTLTAATVTITSGFTTGDVLSATSVGSITVAYSEGVLTLSGTASLADYIATLESVTFHSTSSDPTAATRTLTFQVNDGGLQFNLSNLQTVDVAVTPVNQAPVLASTDAATPLAYTENDAAAAVVPDLVITDDDGTTDNMESAVVALVGFVAGQDVIGYTPVEGLTVDASTPGTLLITGSASAADYQTLLRSITYANSSDNPDTSSVRTFMIKVSDGDAESTFLTRNVTVTAVSDPLVVAANTGITIAENITSNNNAGYITPDMLKVTDPDAPASAITYTLSAIRNANGDSVPTGLVELVYLSGSNDTILVNDTFTQAMIDAYNLNGPGAGDNIGLRVQTEGLDAVFPNNQATLVFTVDNGIDAPVTVEFVVTITQVNDLPSTGGAPDSAPGAPANTVVLLEEVDGNADPQAITGFNHTDEETPAADLIIRVTGMTNSSAGTLLINGSPFVTGENDSLTQSQANAGGLQFVHTGSGEGDEFVVSYQVEDANGGVRTGRTFNIILTPQNDSPVAQNDAVSTDEDSSLSGNVLADNGLGADSDSDSPTLTVTAVDGGTVGTEFALPSGALLTINDDGSFTYNPNGQFEDLAVTETAEDTFTYTIADSDGKTSTAVVTVTINGVNDAPVVTAGQPFVVPENSSGAVVGQIAASDVDGSTEDLTFTLEPSSAPGFAVSASGEITTTTEFDFEANPGPHVILVKATDTNGGESVVEAVTINITNANDAPTIAGPGSLAFLEDKQGNVTGITVTDQDGDLLTLTLAVTDGTLALAGSPSGVTVVSSTGATLVLSGTAADLNAAITADAVEYTGGANDFGTPADTLVATVSDGTASASVNVALNITGINDAPIADPSTINITVDKNSMTTINVVTGANPVETGQTVSLIAVSATNEPGGSVVANFTAGTITYTPNSATSDNSVYTFTYTIRDDGGTADDGKNTTVVTVNVTVINVAPDAVDDAPTVAEGGLVIIDLFANDQSGLGSADPVITHVNGAPVVFDTAITLPGGSLTPKANGLFEYQSDAGVELASDSFTYTISDGTSSDTATVTITITDIDDNPTVIDAPLSVSGTQNEGSTLTFSVGASDGDQGAALSYSWDFGDGSPVVVTNVPTVSHAYADNGSYTATVEVSDRGGTAVTSSLSVAIANVAPTIALSGSAASINEGQSFTLTLGAITDPGSDTIVSGSSAVVITWGDGSVQEVAYTGVGQTISHVYADGAANPARTISVALQDEDGLHMNAGTLGLNVVNVAPTGTAVSGGAVSEGSNGSVTVIGVSDPAGANDTIRFDYDFNNDGVYDLINSSNSTAVVPASYLANGTGTVTVGVRVRDEDGGSSTTSTTIQVNNVAPTVSAVADSTAMIGVPFSQTINFSDPGSEPAGFSYTIDILNGATVVETITGSTSSINRSIPFSKTFDTAGTFTINVTVNDGEANSAVESFDVVVSDPDVLFTELEVVSFTPNTSGFDVVFNQSLGLTDLNLYSGIGGPAADLTLLRNGLQVNGSLVYDDVTNTLSFVKTGGPLLPGNYTLTLKSGAAAFVSADGDLLDGGGVGGNYVNTFTVGGGGEAVLSIPDFARGPGQNVDLTLATADTLTLPIRVSSVSGLLSVDLEVHYDPALLDVTAVTSAVPGMTVVATIDSENGVISITGFSVSPLFGTNLALVNITASVPSDAPYGASQVLRLVVPEGATGVLNEGAIPAITDAAVHKAVFVGDTNGNGGYSPADTGLIPQVTNNQATGFAAHPLTDPVIVGDVSANGSLSGLDASILAQEMIGLNPPQVPDVPAGPIGAFSAVDPAFGVTAPTLVRAGESVTLGVTLDIEDGADVFAAGFEATTDPAALTYGNTAAGDDWNAADWTLASNELSPGQVRALSFNNNGTPSATGLNGIAVLSYQVNANANPGDVATIQIDPLDPNDGDLLWTSGSSSLTVTLDGDHDRDGDVDGRDFLVWQRQYGSTVTVGSGADANLNGVVDGGDLDDWKADYGSSLTAPVAAIVAESTDAVAAVTAEAEPAPLQVAGVISSSVSSTGANSSAVAHDISLLDAVFTQAQAGAQSSGSVAAGVAHDIDDTILDSGEDTELESEHADDVDAVFGSWV